MADEEMIRKTLLQWASDKVLSDASLSSDGSALTKGDITLSNDKITIEHEGKSCQYSLGSVYLQILDPSQGLVAYRNACKQHNVGDPVKALDKPTVLGYFLGTEAVEASDSVVAPAAPAEEAAPKEDKAERTKERERKRSHGKHEHRSRSKDSKRKEHKRRSTELEKKDKKKPKKLVTNEQLFDNLNVVVEKRKMEQGTQEEITKALSTEGFEVTPELLEEYKEKTRIILANEIPVGNSASILRAANPRKDLSRVLELFNETVNPAKSKPSSKPSTRNATPTGKPKQDKSYLKGKKPVIVVPKGMTAPITLINAHEFLANARFVSRDVMIKQGGRQRVPPTTFTRNVRVVGGNGTGLVEYEILDNPKKLGANPKEWERIVAVIVLGQGWQFKDWPNGYKDPVRLFSMTYGFFISMEGDKLPPEVSGWRLKQAKLNRDKRGLDSVTFASFWNGLDEWMQIHKQELLPQAES